MLKITGTGAKPTVYEPRLDHESSMSKAYANRSCARSRWAASYTSRQYQPQ